MARTRRSKPSATDAATLARQAEKQDPESAADLLEEASDTTIVDVLQRI